MIKMASLLLENMQVFLTRQDAQEVLYKLGTVASEPDLQNDYGITQEQATALIRSIPQNGGEWKFPDEMMEVVKGEMADHVVVLRDIATDAFNSNNRGEALRINKLARRLELLFNLLPR